MEFSNEISVNGMVLTPRGVFVVWEYDWLVPGKSDEKTDTDGESVVNRDVGAPEDSECYRTWWRVMRVMTPFQQ